MTTHELRIKYCLQNLYPIWWHTQALTLGTGVQGEIPMCEWHFKTGRMVRGGGNRLVFTKKYTCYIQMKKINKKTLNVFPCRTS